MDTRDKVTRINSYIRTGERDIEDMQLAAEQRWAIRAPWHRFTPFMRYLQWWHDSRTA